ncbi:WD40 repeat domain-containing protein [bacterium]|nr:WD40 repeat domain-containing protein [bacterium]
MVSRDAMKPVEYFTPFFFLSPDRLAAGYIRDEPGKSLDSGTVILSVPGLRELRRIRFFGLAAVAPDGVTAAVVTAGFADRGQTLTLWDLTTEKDIHRLAIDPGTRFDRLAFRPDGKQLFASGGKSYVFDTTTGKTVTAFQNAHGGTRALRPDGKTIADSGAPNPWTGIGGVLGFRDVTTAEVSYPPGRRAVVLGNPGWMRYTPDGRLLVLVDRDGLAVWDAAAEQLVDIGKREPIEFGFEGGVTFTDAADGLYVTTASRRGAIRVWKVRSPARQP